jgi:ATP-binding cassette subfamily C protein
MTKINFFSIIKRYLFPHKKQLFMIIIANLIIIASSLATPYLISYFIDNVLINKNISLMYNILVIMVILIAFGKLSSYISNLYSTKLHAISYVLFNLDVINHVQRLPLSYFYNINTVYLNAKINDDTDDIITFIINDCINTIVNFIFIITIYLIILYYDTVISNIFLCICIIDLFIYKYFTSFLYKIAYQKKERQNIFFSKLNEQISKIKFIKINAIDKILRRDALEEFDKLLKIYIKYTKISCLYMISGKITRRIATLCILFFGGIRVINNELTIGEFVVIMGYFTIGYGCLDSLPEIGKIWQDISVAINRINEILNEDIELFGNVKLDKQIETITLSNLSLSYDTSDSCFIKDFTYTFSKGKIYCISGENGAGKSSLAYSLIGLIKPKCGFIQYNNTNINAIDIDDLRQRIISFSEQEPVLLNASLKLNLQSNFNESESEFYEKLIMNAKYFGVDYLIRELKNDRTIGDDAKNISGGEKQKLSLMRTFIKNSQVIILDEPTSALDAASTEKLKQYLYNIKLNKIIIIITHDQQFSDIADDIIKIHGHV